MTRTETIYDIMNPTNTIGLNRYLAHAIGRDAAIVYSALLSKSKYYSERGTAKGGWFYSTAADLEESTAIPLYYQRSAIKTLVKCGLILCERRGLPAKRSFYIVENADILQGILAEGEQIAREINPVVYNTVSERAKSHKAEEKHFEQQTEIESCDEFCTYSSGIDAINYSNYEEGKYQDVKNFNIKVLEESTPSHRKNLRHTYYNPKGIKTKENVNQSIAQSADMIDTMDSNAGNKSSYLDVIKENIGYDYLCEANKYNKDYVDEIALLMADVVSTNRKTVRVCGENKPTEVVKSVFLKLDESHIQYVIDSMMKNATKVRNVRNYLITALYNAKFTLNSYYRSLVNHDMYGKLCDGGVQ